MLCQSCISNVLDRGGLFLHDAKRKSEVWRTDYDEEHPHEALGYLTPTELARQHGESRFQEVSDVALEDGFPDLGVGHLSKGEILIWICAIA
jgi:hypothetical protein